MKREKSEREKRERKLGRPSTEEAWQWRAGGGQMAHGGTNGTPPPALVPYLAHISSIAVWACQHFVSQHATSKKCKCVKQILKALHYKEVLSRQRNCGAF